MEFPDCSPGRPAQRMAVTLGESYQEFTRTGPTEWMTTIVLLQSAVTVSISLSPSFQRVRLLRSPALLSTVM